MSRKYKFYQFMAIPLLAVFCASCGLLEQAKGFFAGLTQKRNPDEQLVNHTDALQARDFKGDLSEFTPEDQKNYKAQQVYWELKQKHEEEEIITEMKATEQKTKKKKQDRQP